MATGTHRTLLLTCAFHSIDLDADVRVFVPQHDRDHNKMLMTIVGEGHVSRSGRLGQDAVDQPLDVPHVHHGAGWPGQSMAVQVMEATVMLISSQQHCPVLHDVALGILPLYSLHSIVPGRPLPPMSHHHRHTPIPCALTQQSKCQSTSPLYVPRGGGLQ